MSGISGERLGDPADLAGGQAARQSQEIASRAAELSLEESRRQFDIGQARLEPFVEQAVPAFQMQAALSGARGPEAQEQALSGFAASPATQFLKESGLSLSGQGTTGERRRALEKFNQGLALQDFGASFNRLGAVAGSGQAAASSLVGAGEEAARQSVEAQQRAFSAQQQGLAAQQASRSALAETGAGLGAFFAGGGSGGSGGGGGFGGSQTGVGLNQRDVRGQV